MINIYERKYKALIDYLEKDNEFYEIISEINKKNYLNLAEFKSVINGADFTDAFLRENGIFYMIAPRENFFEFEMIIALEDCIISIPCFPISEEKEWEAERDNIKVLNHEDLRQVKKDLAKTSEDFIHIVKTHEVELLTEDLGGTVRL